MFYLLNCKPFGNFRQSMKESESRLVMTDSLQPHGLYSPGKSPGHNIVVGRLSLLQGLFPTPESNHSLLHCGWIFYQQSYQGRQSVSDSKWEQEHN